MVLKLTNCIQRQIPVEDFPGERGWFGEDTEENAANRLTKVSMALPSLRRQYETLKKATKTALSTIEAEALLNAAKLVDDDLRDWSDTLPPSWRPKFVSISPEPEGNIMEAPEWPGPQHMYQDVFMSSIINDYRVSRIFCQTVVTGCLDFLGTSHREEVPGMDLLTAQYITQKMVDEICSSVTFHLNFDVGRRAKVSEREQVGKFTGSRARQIATLY